jgi:hypothetical protein
MDGNDSLKYETFMTREGVMTLKFFPVTIKGKAMRSI